MKSCCLWQVDCARSGITADSRRSTFLFEFRLKTAKMWITRVWNPFPEFPDLLQVLQEKVRQNVIWGYWRLTGNSPSPFYLVTGEVSSGTPPVGFASKFDWFSLHPVIPDLTFRHSGLDPESLDNMCKTGNFTHISSVLAN